jgi:phosphopantothenoylcysteine decarboxylase/phosphopantothenate--cysteine ligase
MAQATADEFPSAHLLLMAAAPADFRAGSVGEGKLSREGGGLDLSLEPTEDILAGLTATRGEGQTVVGFAAEHGEGGVGRAREKLARKGVDLIVLNDVSDPTIGFDSAENAVTLVEPNSETPISRASKDEIAEHILDRVDALRAEGRSPQPTDTQSSP